MKSLNLRLIRTIIFLVFSFVFIGVSSPNQNPAVSFKSDLDDPGLKGKVRSLTIAMYKATNNSGTIQKGDIKSKNTDLFDSNGNILESQVFDANAGTLTKTINRYDDKGKLTTSIKQFGNVDDEFSKTTYRYDEKGKIIEQIEYAGDIVDFKTVYKYDGKGNEIEKSKYMDDGSLYSKATSKYDEKGNKTEDIQYGPRGDIDVKYLSRFDEKGNRIETGYYDSNNVLTGKSTHKYDEKGNQIESTSFLPDGKIFSNSILKYDEEGKKIEELSSYGSNTKKITYKYDKIDKNGNWLLKIQEGDPFEAGNPVTVTERVIEYFEE